MSSLLKFLFIFLLQAELFLYGKSQSEARSLWRLKILCDKPSHKLSTLPTLLVVGIVKKKKLLFQIVTWLQIDHVIKYSCDFKGGSLWRYIRIGVHESSTSEDKIYLICDVTSQDKPINGSCNLMVGSTSWYIHPDKFCDRRHCDSRNIMFLIYHVTSGEHMLKGLCGFMGGSHSR